jgi:hypothetical protein
MKRLNTLQDIFSSQQNIYDAKSLFTTLGEIRSTYNRLNISHSEYADLIDHGEKADLNELEELVDNVETDATDEFEFFTTLIIRVEEKQESSKTKFWNIVLTLIISYIMSVWAPIHLNPWSDDVSQEIKETHTTNDFRSYRYVTAKRGLLVRVDSNQKSQIIGGLPYGSPVRFLRKSDDRNWTFIEDEDGNQGWVFSRYLKKSR